MFKKQFLRSLLTFVLVCAFILPTSIFLCSSCSKKKKQSKYKSLNIASAHVESKLTENLEKEFREEYDVKSSIQQIEAEKAIPSLINGDVDLFIGTLDIPVEFENDITKVALAKNAIIFVVNPNNSIRTINHKQVLDIFSGVINNWKELGGENKPVMVLNRPNSSIIRKTFNKLVFPSSTVSIPESDVIVKRCTEVQETIRKYPNAISYVNYSSLESGVKTLNLNNIPATSSNISKGYFPFSRPVFLYFNIDLLKSKGKYSTIKKFINFTHDDDGLETTAESGYIQLSEGELELARFDKEPYKIGVSAPTEGAYTDLGRSIINSAKLAAEEINKDGGIDGVPVELVICNDKAVTTEAIKCAKKLVKNNVLGVIGHLTSQASIETSKIYAKHKIAQITPASTHPWFTERPDSRGYAFRTCGRDDQEAKLIADIVRNLDLKHPTSVSIFNNGTIYGTTLSALIEDEISKYGTDKVIDIKAFKQEQKQYYKEIKDLQSKVLVFVGEYGDAGNIVKNLALNNNPDIIFIGADGVHSKRFIEEGGLRSEGAYVIGSAANENSLAIKEFHDEYKSKFKTDETAFAVYSYDAFNILIEAIKESKSKKPQNVAKTIKDTEYSGLMGIISFDEKGDPILPRMAVYKVIDGEFVKQ